jgi:hypothetical protein
LHFNLCQSVQRPTETRVVTQSAELTTTVLVAEVQALLARIEQPRTFCLLQVALVESLISQGQTFGTPAVVVVPVEHLETMRWVEAQLVEMVLEIMQIQWRQMVLPTPAVVVAVRRTDLEAVAAVAAAVGQESSLFVIQFQQLRLFQRFL